MLKTKKLEASYHLVAFAIIFLVTFSIYWNSLGGDFIWDDRNIIIEHTGYLGDWKNLFLVFTEPFFGKTPFYRPLLIESFIIDYQLWNSHPFGFHLTNTLLHTMNAFMVYLLAFMFFRHRYLAVFAGLLFATHTLQTEAVAWISGRNDVLLTFFTLLTIVLYARWHNLKGTKRVVAFVGFLTSYGCVLLTKESGLIVILLIILVDYFFQSTLYDRIDGRMRAYLAIVLISFLYIYIRMKIFDGIGLGHMEDAFTYRLVKVFVVQAHYFKLLLFPICQTANPFIPYITSIKDPIFIFSFSLILSLMIITITCWKYFREVSFVILWIFISLLPVSGIVSLTFPALEHRLYLGSVGFAMMVPLVLFNTLCFKRNMIFFKKDDKAIVFLVLFCIIVLYSCKSVVRNTIWKDESYFWEETVQDSPFSVFAHNNLGVVYVRKEQYNKAIEKFKKALLLNSDPNIASVSQRLCQKSIIYNNMGSLYYKALRKSQRLAKINSDQVYVGADMVFMHGEQGIYQKALDSFKRAIRFDRLNAEAHNNLGDLYYFKKYYQPAEKEYKFAIELNPYYADAYNNLGLVYLNKKNYDAAQKEFSKALKLKPDYAEAYNNLALVYFNKGMYNKALEVFDHALKLMPENAEVYFNMALVYLKDFKDIRKGIYCLEESLRLDPHQYRASMIRDTLLQLGSGELPER